MVGPPGIPGASMRRRSVGDGSRANLEQLQTSESPEIILGCSITQVLLRDRARNLIERIAECGRESKPLVPRFAAPGIRTFRPTLTGTS